MTDSSAKEFSSVLDMFGLWQHVTEPTHLRGHTLDLVISKGVVDISSVVVIDLALSDHFCILSDLLITQNVQTTSFSVKKRYINEKTSAQFREAIAMSPTGSCCGGCTVVWWLAPSPHSKKVPGSTPVWGLSVWSLHVLPVYAWVLSGYSGFLLC